MNSLLNSSVGKKLTMGLAGLFLCAFLALHLTINLLLLKNDEGAVFTSAVEFMTTNIVIRIMEIVLFGGFIIHISYGVVVQIQNWMARPTRYAKANNAQTSFFSKYMIHTGAIIFAFLVIHLMNFYSVKLGLVGPPVGQAVVEGPEDFYHMAINLFSNKAYSIIYITFMIFLGFHLIHAFQSAFQTLGWNHKRYSPIIGAVGWIYTIVITVGFSIIPLYFMFFYHS